MGCLRGENRKCILIRSKGYVYVRDVWVVGLELFLLIFVLNHPGMKVGEREAIKKAWEKQRGKG